MAIFQLSPTLDVPLALLQAGDGVGVLGTEFPGEEERYVVIIGVAGGMWR